MSLLPAPGLLTVVGLTSAANWTYDKLGSWSWRLRSIAIRS